MVRPTGKCASDTSVSSEVEELSFDEKRVQIFAKQMLHGRLFMGNFQEKRYVDSLNAYRDVIAISREEQDLIQDILAVKQRIDKLYLRDHWIGITTPDVIGAPASHSLWVELPETATFGFYWFKIRRVKFGNNETCLRVKIIRPVCQDAPGAVKEGNEQDYDNWSDMAMSIKKSFSENFSYFLTNVTTIDNAKGSIVFLCMLLSTVVVLFLEILKHVAEYLLKFLNEFSKFMHSVAPIFEILANLVDRLFRTLCMLILYLCKGSSSSKNVQYRQYIPYQNLKALPAATKKRGVIIEEIE